MINNTKWNTSNFIIIINVCYFVWIRIVLDYTRDQHATNSLSVTFVSNRLKINALCTALCITYFIIQFVFSISMDKTYEIVYFSIASRQITKLKQTKPQTLKINKSATIR